MYYIINNTSGYCQIVSLSIALVTSFLVVPSVSVSSLLHHCIRECKKVKVVTGTAVYSTYLIPSSKTNSTTGSTSVNAETHYKRAMHTYGTYIHMYILHNVIQVHVYEFGSMHYYASM
jgi:hypothetical protein